MSCAFHRNIFRVSVNYIQGKRNFLPIFYSSICRSNLVLDNIKRIMSTVYVKNVKDDDRLHINVDLSINGGVKSFNLYRLKAEEHGTALERLRLSIVKKVSNMKKKKKTSDSGSTSKSEEELDISFNIFHDKQKLLPSVENEKAWIEGAVLRCGEEDIYVVYNAPTVKLDKFPKIIMADFPLFPIAEYEFCDMGSCDFYWKVVKQNKVDACKQGISKGEMFDFNDFYCNSYYTPSISDIGCHILLVCVPKNGEREGKPDSLVSAVRIESGPSGKCPFEKRHEFTRTRPKDAGFRVVSYNILADIYSSTDFAQNQLFSYCPKNALDMDYRKHLLLKEIVGYQADLMFLQEVDKSVFASHLSPALKSLGYEGLLCLKSGQVSEGCATFIRTEKFRIVNQVDIVLSEYLTQDPSCQDIWKKVEKVESLRENIEQRSSILQVTIVESNDKPNKFLCLANTHLYFHPEACNIRLIHAATALRHLQNIITSYEQEGKSIGIVFCGDFNSAPHLGIFQLFTSQFVPSDHVDWISGGDLEALTDLELSHTMNIESACGCPEYTNFTSGFQSTLDYIFIDASKLKTTSVIPMPDHSDVTANVALPSIVFPSDHIALVCDMEFVDR